MPTLTAAGRLTVGCCARLWAASTNWVVVSVSAFTVEIWLGDGRFWGVRGEWPQTYVWGVASGLALQGAHRRCVVTAIRGSGEQYEPVARPVRPRTTSEEREL